jgi:hypothetical protein
MTAEDRNNRAKWGHSLPRSWIPDFNMTHRRKAEPRTDADAQAAPAKPGVDLDALADALRLARVEAAIKSAFEPRLDVNARDAQAEAEWVATRRRYRAQLAAAQQRKTQTTLIAIFATISLGLCVVSVGAVVWAIRTTPPPSPIERGTGG